MVKNKKIISLGVLVLGIVFIGVGAFLGFKVKDNIDTLSKEFKISGDYVVRVNDNLISSTGSKYAYYDLTGKKIIELESDVNIFDSSVLELMNTKDDLFVFTKDSVLYGVVDSAKKEILPNKYGSVKIVSKNCFIVMSDDGLYRVVNATGEDLLGIGFDYTRVYEGVGATLSSGDNWIIIDENGNNISKNNYIYIVDYKEDKNSETILVGQASDDTSDMFIFKNGSVNIIEKISNSIFLSEKAIYYGVSDGTFSAYNFSDGKIKKNAEVDFSSNGMISTISDDGLLGFKSTDGKTVIKEQYQIDGTSDFTKYGLAIVSVNNLKGIIDKTGKQIIPCKYKALYVFSDKVFVVSDDDNQTYYLIDNNDKKIYDKVLYEGLSNFIVAYNGDKCGIVGESGKNITELNNLNCMVYSDSYLVEESKGSWVVGRK